MGSARGELLANIEGVRRAAGDQLLQRIAPLPANQSINKTAELLRRGLYIVAFNAMEDYLKKRVGEHFSNLSAVSSLDFDDLPPGLRRAAVIDAIKNGMREAGYDKSNRIKIIRAVAGAVASTDNRQHYNIHEYSLLRSGSNVSADDIGSAIRSLHIDNPWGQMQNVLDLVGNVGAPIQGRFETSGLKRNAAAHGDVPIEYSDLVEITDLVVPLCFAFDVIFSAGMTRLANNVSTSDTTAKIQLQGNVAIRFVSQHHNRWCRLNQYKRPLRYFPTRNDAVQHSLKNLPAMGAVAVLGQLGEITGWHLADQRHPHH